MYSLVVVEDEDESRRGLIDYIPWNEFGFSITADFSNAKSALDYLHKHDAAVLLTDIMMPGMNGIELIEEVKELRPSIIPVVLSGHSDFAYARRCISLGVREYILKPAGYDELKEVFERIKAELDSKDDTRRRISSDELVDTMQKYIAENLDTVSLKALSDKFSLNQYYISELFHQVSGSSFQEYTADERMKEAMHLLKNSHLSIGEISSRVGYTSPSSFARTFRERTGLTPKEYRVNG